MKNLKPAGRSSVNIQLFVFFCAINVLLFNTVVSTWAKAPTTARIVFMSIRDDNGEIYTMTPDGTLQRNLTRHPALDREPVWSPTGEQILFASDRLGVLDLYVMDPDGVLPSVIRATV